VSGWWAVESGVLEAVGGDRDTISRREKMGPLLTIGYVRVVATFIFWIRRILELSE
jgi:hypothetical protein